jgi:hypothetical protein
VGTSGASRRFSARRCGIDTRPTGGGQGCFW